MLSRSPRSRRRSAARPRAAGAGDLLRRAGAGAAAEQGHARPLRLLLADRALDLVRQPARHAGRGRGRRAAVEQHAQRVDVARGGDRLPPHLLGAGVARGHHPRAGRRQVGAVGAGPRLRAAWRCRSRAAWARPPAVTRMLAGLRSRWTSRFWWAYWTAAQIRRKRSSRWSTASRWRSQYSSTRQALDQLHHQVGAAVLACCRRRRGGRCWGARGGRGSAARRGSGGAPRCSRAPSGGS